MAGLETHLQLIQTAITRLAGQSTTIKGWCVTLTSALLGVSATTSTPLTGALALYVIVTFAVLDAYYLTLERAYRALYDTAASDATTSPSWTMTVSRPRPMGVVSALRSPAISLLYTTSIIVAVAVTAYTTTR